MNLINYIKQLFTTNKVQKPAGNVFITKAIYNEKTQILDITFNNGIKEQVCGNATVWHSYPIMKRLITSNEAKFCDIWKYIKQHGNPYPTAHLNKI